MRENNFGLLRLVLALLVLYSHSYHLTLGPKSDPLENVTHGQHALGMLAVGCFFAISGYLISQSWLRSSASSFIRKRVLRILPGFWVSCVFSVGLAACTSPAPLAYIKGLALSADQVLRHGLLLQSGALNSPGVYANSPFHPGEVNTSQWTLPPEVVCYSLVAVSGSLGLLSRRFTIAVFLFSWTAYAYFARFPDQGEYTLFRLAAFFFGGATLQFFPLYRSPSVVALAALLAVGSVFLSKPFFLWCLPLCVPILMLAIGTARQIPVRRFPPTSISPMGSTFTRGLFSNSSCTSGTSANRCPCSSQPCPS